MVQRAVNELLVCDERRRIHTQRGDEESDVRVDGTVPLDQGTLNDCKLCRRV